MSNTDHHPRYYIPRDANGSPDFGPLTVERVCCTVLDRLERHATGARPLSVQDALVLADTLQRAMYGSIPTVTDNLFRNMELNRRPTLQEIMASHPEYHRKAEQAGTGAAETPAQSTTQAQEASAPYVSHEEFFASVAKSIANANARADAIAQANANDARKAVDALHALCLRYLQEMDAHAGHPHKTGNATAPG